MQAENMVLKTGLDQLVQPPQNFLVFIRNKMFCMISSKRKKSHQIFKINLKKICPIEVSLKHDLNYCFGWFLTIKFKGFPFKCM